MALGENAGQSAAWVVLTGNRRIKPLEQSMSINGNRVRAQFPHRGRARPLQREEDKRGTSVLPSEIHLNFLGSPAPTGRAPQSSRGCGERGASERAGGGVDGCKDTRKHPDERDVRASLVTCHQLRRTGLGGLAEAVVPQGTALPLVFPLDAVHASVLDNLGVFSPGGPDIAVQEEGP